MKIRLEGTKQEIKWAIAALKHIYSVREQSKLYQNRDGVSCRCYLEVVPLSAEANQKQSDELQPQPWDAVLGTSSNEHQ